MSFILDALKKLEREKETREPGVVMVGPVPWGERDHGPRGRWLVLAGAALAVALAGSFFWLWSGAGPNPVQTGEEEPAAPIAPAASGGRSAAPSDQRASETTGTAPAVAGGRTARAPAPGPAPPPPRDLRLPAAETARPVEVEAPPPAADTTAPPTTAGPDATASEDPASVASDEAGPASSVDDAEPEALVEEVEPAAAPAVPVPEYRLTAISSRDGRPIALLNDRLVREGDRFGDVLVVRIGESDVEIEVDGERMTVGF